MWHVWWWLIPLLVFMAMRGNHRRWQRGGGRFAGRRLEGERESGTSLSRTVEEQRVYIEQLEGRLSRVEEGLEFAERLLAERGASTAK